MKIRVIKTEVTDKGKFKLNKVTYRNLETGKTLSANLPSFKSPEVFEVFTKAVADSTWDVKVEKDGDFWVWTKAEELKDVPAEVASPAPTGRKGTSTDRDWETAQERAVRQILIVRQSSIDRAMEFGEQKDLDTVFVLASKIEDWVLRGFQKQLSEKAGEDTPLDVQAAMKAILEMPNDVPV